MMKKNATISNVPSIGMGATVNHWTDRSAVTLIQITHNGKRLVLQEDKATRTDNNGMSESQQYEFERDPNGAIYHATLRKDGTFRVTGSTRIVHLGNRYKYHDFSF